MGELAYCEPVDTAINKWCIRELTGTGRHLGGGVDTPSFCGRVRVGWGWDLSPPVVIEEAVEMSTTRDHAGFLMVCPECVRAITGRDAE